MFEKKSMNLLSDFNLKGFNSFGLNSEASRFFSFTDKEELKRLVRSGRLQEWPVYILGGGSNVLCKEVIPGIVIHPVLKGISILSESTTEALIEVAASENWDDFVAFCVDKEFYGLENLSWIPGHVGASPVQNIGAYGVEAGSCIEKVCGINLNDGQEYEFSKHECQFGYRSSIFKTELKNTLLITSVIFRLSKTAQWNLSYGDVCKEVDKRGGLNLRNVRDAIISIRKSKLPDPNETGNAGSFFKNPVVSGDFCNKLLANYPQMPFYQSGEGLTKIPAAWLIEQTGWKGQQHGKVGVHPNQALVLINLGGASFQDVMELSDLIITQVSHQFGIVLEREVNILGE